MEHITSILIDYIATTLPWLLFVDEDTGQLEALGDETRDNYPLTFPAVLINIDSVDWSNAAEGDQIGQANIRVRLLIDCYDDMHAGSGGTKKAAERQALCHQLHTALNGYRPQSEGALVRSRSAYYAGGHNIKVYDQFYTLTMKEATHRRTTTAAPKLKLSVSAVSAVSETP